MAMMWWRTGAIHRWRRGTMAAPSKWSETRPPMPNTSRSSSGTRSHEGSTTEGSITDTSHQVSTPTVMRLSPVLKATYACTLPRGIEAGF